MSISLDVYASASDVYLYSSDVYTLQCVYSEDVYSTMCRCVHASGVLYANDVQCFPQTRVLVCSPSSPVPDELIGVHSVL